MECVSGVGRLESETSMVTEAPVSVAVGVPEIVSVAALVPEPEPLPGWIDSVVGRLFAEIMKEYGGIPPLAMTACEYCVFTVAAGNAVFDGMSATGEAAATVSVKVAD